MTFAYISHLTAANGLKSLLPECFQEVWDKVSLGTQTSTGMHAY